MDTKPTLTNTEDDSSIALLDGNFVLDADTKGTKKEKDKDKNEEIAKVSIFKLWSFADCFDVLLIIIGCIVSIVSSFGMPFMSVIIGDISGSFINVTRLYDDPDAMVNISGTESVPFSFTYSMIDFRESVIENCWRYLIVGTVIFIASTIQVICFQVSSENMIHRMRKAFFQALLHQDISWFDENSSGTITTKMFDNLERVKEGTGDKIGSLIGSLSQFILGFGIAFFYDWKLTLLMMSLTPIMAILGLVLAKIVARLSTDEADKTAKAGAIAEEALTSIRTVVAFNGVTRECDRYDKALDAAKNIGIKLSLYVGIGLMIIFIVIFGSFSFAFWVGVDFVANGSISPETVLIVFFSVMMSSMALAGIGDQFSSLGKARGSAAAIFKIIDRKPEIDSYSSEGIKLDSIQGKISIQSVKFSYPTRPDIDILKGLSFDVQPGQTVALVGTSGCGKSTIIQLLLRYYNPKDGKIFLDGHRLSGINIESLRRNIGLVSQEPVLFDCSIEENIRYGNSDVSEAEIIAACRLANIENFISQLPDGFKTMVGERGVQLSGGQKQRIAIARALVRNPKILLLDEATSALDAESESLVQQALEKAKENRTTIVIAHRLSTIRNADQIIAMKLGEIVESGKHDELMAKKGFYYELVHTQVFMDIEEKATTPVTPTQVALRPISFHRQFSVPKSRTSGPTTPKGNPFPFNRMLSIDQEVNVQQKTNKEKIKRKSVRKEEKEDDDEKSETERLKEELEQEGGKRQGFRKILLYAKPEWKFLIIALIASSLSGFMFLGFSLFFTQIIQVFSITDIERLKAEGHFWALMFLSIGVFQGTTVFVSIIFFALAAERMTKRLRSNLFKNVMRMDIAYFDMPHHSSGKISTRLATDTPNIKSAIDEQLGGVLQAVVSLALGISFSFYYGWQMALVMLTIFPIAGVAQWWEMKYFEERHEKDKKENENAGHLALQAIENIRTVQSLTLEKTFYDQFSAFLEIPHKTSTNKALIQAFTFAFSSAISYFLYAISFRYGLYLIENGSMQPMHVMRVLFAISFTTGSIGWAAGYFPQYAKARLAAGIVFKMLEEKPRIDSLSKHGVQKDIKGSIEIKDVQFAYYERPDVRILQGVDLLIKPGQTLAIVGPSGCGKSTIIALLERFYDPYGGEILIDGTNIQQINVSNLRSNIALVSQEPILFDCSIKENITYGLDSSTISFDRIRNACRLANIADFIENNLPDAYETRVGEKGVQLSGGQKQRIAIARALLRDPKILLLDEATSALDAESEKVVQKTLDRASESRTCIVIAHRLSTIVNADIIAVMKNGVVIEKGTHSELMSKKGVYYELTQKQNMKSA